MRDPMGTVAWWIPIAVTWAVQELVTMAYEVSLAQDNANDQAAMEARLLANATNANERAIIKASRQRQKAATLTALSDQTRECADTLMPAREAGDIRDAINVVTGD
jgi:hypothetical protein